MRISDWSSDVCPSDLRIWPPSTAIKKLNFCPVGAAPWRCTASSPLTDTKRPTIASLTSVYASPRVIPLLVLGFASGLPLALTGGTLQAWATIDNVSLQNIGFLTLIGTAYTLKFLWAPLVDRYSPPVLGRRRSWIFFTQILLAAAIACMGLFSPARKSTRLNSSH